MVGENTLTLPSPAGRGEKGRRADKHLWLAMLIAAAVLFPRSAMVVRSQSERVDDEYHLRRGIHYLKRNLEGNEALPLNDPPLGEGLTALRMWMAGCWPKGKSVQSALYGYRLSADSILMIVGMWKVLLFLPCVGVSFCWVRRTYGVRAAWLALALVLVEPTIAAHVALPTLDVLGMEGIVIGCFLWWRFFELATWGRLVAAAGMTGVAMMLKHTAVILPAVAGVMAVAWWWRGSFSLRENGWKLAAAPAVAFVTIWGLCFFDFHKPLLPVGWEEDHPKLAKMIDRKLPAATYLGSFLEGHSHADDGHHTYLFQKRGKKGVWYYFPVVASYKVPVGIEVVMVLGVLSLFVGDRKSPSPPPSPGVPGEGGSSLRWEELGFVIPMVAWAALMMTSNINIGWRHFLPAFVFMLMLASRVAVMDGRGWRIAAWCCVVVAAGHVLSYHPDYLSYINWPRQKAYLAISDSNVDWGQGLKDVNAWLDRNPGRKVCVRDFGWGPERLFNVRKRIGDRATVLDRGDPLPREGVLIISPVPVAGVYERSDPFRVLRDKEPVEVLGHSMLVYDLDRLRGDKAFGWPKYREAPLDEKGVPRKPPEGSPKNLHPWG